MKKILVVRYRFIGDTILSIPFLRNLRYANPDAQIDMLVAPGSGEIVEDCPYVDNFIYFDTTRKYKYEKAAGKKKNFWYYVKLLRKQKYDKAYILKRSFSSAILCFFAGINQRIGYDTEFRSCLLTKKIPYDKNKHESLCFLDLLKSDGIEVKDTYLESWINPETNKKIDDILFENRAPKDKKMVVVSVTATNEGKIWDINNFARIIEYLSNEKNLQVLFLGSDEDREIYHNIKYNTALKIIPLNLCGFVNLKESLALLKRSEFIVGNDSGGLHMASSVGTPVIGLYGPMSVDKWRALGDNNICLKADLPCIPCGLSKKCPNDKACMKAIKVEQVKAAIDEILNKITV
ncbi:lipopolysaccharide heptosyltransferase II [bacterium]|nr:lipopolysaccharide heptosyltransferase II [bacterium]